MSECGPSALCAETVDLPPGPHSLYLRASPDGELWSAASNRLDTFVLPPEAAAAVRCLTDDVCRADYDADGYVSAWDFSRWFSAFGETWE